MDNDCDINTKYYGYDTYTNSAYRCEDSCN
jgi:hypothetical protein